MYIYVRVYVNVEVKPRKRFLLSAIFCYSLQNIL